MANRWIFPSGSVRKAIAWLPLNDAYQAAVVDRRWRACATCTIVSYISSKDIDERIKACRLIQGLCTDLQTLHASIVADVTIALIKLLQDTKQLNTKTKKEEITPPKKKEVKKNNGPVPCPAVKGSNGQVCGKDTVSKCNYLYCGYHKKYFTQCQEC